MEGAARLHATPVAADGRAPEKWALVLHGIYGRGRNWLTVAREVATRRPEWGFWLTDLRLHGDSPAMAPPHTVAAAAEDVANLATSVDALHPVRAVLGHSFAGKVTLSLASRLAQVLHQIWVVDSTPDARVPDGTAWRMLEIVRSLPDRFASRADATAALEARGLAPGVAAWMSTNLRRTADGFTWRLDFEAMEALLRDFFATDFWPVVEHPPGRVVLHFVKAQESSTLSEQACARIEAIGRANGRVHLDRVTGGHWVNTENPSAIVELLTQHLP
jgi:Alpha/beta hydrolase family